MNIETAVAAIKNGFHNLNDRDMAFAFDLVGAFDRRGAVSEKQAKWLLVLAERATGKQEAANASVGDMGGVYALFEAAKASGLKFPKIVAMSPVGEIKLSVAGPNAKAPGTVNVAENGPFGEAQWYGRIHKDGTFEGRSAPAELVEYLRAFATNPAEQAALHGRRTGNCCFCCKELTEKGSIEVGYGPICASRFGLDHPQNEKKVAA